MKTVLWAGITALMVTVLAGFAAIPLLRRLRAGQPVLKYVEEHKDKDGTPTMGGLFFILSAAAVFLLFGGGRARTGLVAMTIGLAFMAVGFIDDFLKVRYRRNEGLKAYQKIIFQTVIAFVAAYFAYKNGLTGVFIPFYAYIADIGVFIIPLAFFIFIAITNSVNLTDGLDGLAGGSSLAYLICLAFLISAESSLFPGRATGGAEREAQILLIACLAGAVGGFLLFNVSRARVFMGDSGSLSLGGFLGAVSIFTGNSLFIPVMGIVFVVSSLSVIIQVLYYKRTRKRVFLMAPFHHHLQMKGYSESKIAYVYSLITVITGVLSVIFYI